MEYSFDMLTSFIIFSIAFSLLMLGVVATIYTVLRTQTMALLMVSEPYFPVKLEVIYLGNNTYEVRAKKPTYVYVVVIKSRDEYWTTYAVTPAKVKGSLSDWVIVFAYSGIGVKVGNPITGRLTVSRYCIACLKPIPPYVVIQGSSYTIVPNFEVAEVLKGPATYFIKNGTVVTALRG